MTTRRGHWCVSVSRRATVCASLRARRPRRCRAHRRVGATRAVEMAPTVRARRAWRRPARLRRTVHRRRTARHRGGAHRRAARRADPDPRWRVGATGTSVTLTDQRSGESFDVSARAVINASGVWAGEVDTSIRLRPSRGTHLVFDAASFGNPVAALTDSDPRRDQPVRVRDARAAGARVPRVHRRGRARPRSRCAGTLRRPRSVPARHRQRRAGRRARSRRRHRRVCRASAADRHRTGAGTRATCRVITPSSSRRRGRQRRRRQAHRVPPHGRGVVDRAVRLRGLTAGPCRTRDLPLVGAPSNPVATLRSPVHLPSSLVARYGAEAPNVVVAAELRATD